MDDNAIHEWLIKCFGPIQGEMAWQQISQLPEEIREQLMSQDPSRLPNPSEVQQMMAAFSAGGLNTMGDMQRTVEEGPINVKLAKSIALQQANASGSASSVSAVDGEAARRAMSEANLWLDTACEFNPAPGDPDVLTRAGWVEGTIDQWAKFAAPVAESMNDALASVISERLGGAFGDGEIAGMFAGPVPIPIPDGMKDPAQLMKLLGNTSFAMQLGHAAGNLSHEVHGSFDQGIALLKNPAGGLIAQNATEYAKMLNGEASAARPTRPALQPTRSIRSPHPPTLLPIPLASLRPATAILRQLTVPPKSPALMLPPMPPTPPRSRLRSPDSRPPRKSPNLKCFPSWPCRKWLTPACTPRYRG